MTERGWVSYLSPSDRDRLPAGGGKTRAFGLGRSPALLVVDVYREALGTRDDADDLERWPMSCGTEAWAVVDRISELISEFRRRSLPVIHVTGAEMYTRWGHQEPAKREPDFTIVPEVAPRADEIVLGKSAPSAFQGTSLAFHLVALGIDTLIICGEATSGCVRASVVDAATHRYRVGVVEDGCFDRVEASHWINLFDMEQKYADVMTSDEVVAFLDLVADGATALR